MTISQGPSRTNRQNFAIPLCPGHVGKQLLKNVFLNDWVSFHTFFIFAISLESRLNIIFYPYSIFPVNTSVLFIGRFFFKSLIPLEIDVKYHSLRKERQRHKQLKQRKPKGSNTLNDQKLNPHQVLSLRARNRSWEPQIPLHQ